jgi:hypothetical protein
MQYVSHNVDKVILNPSILYTLSTVLLETSVSVIAENVLISVL